MKRKVVIYFGLLALIIVSLLGFSAIQKNQSEDSHTESILIDKDGNQVEPITEDATIYGE